MAKLLCNFIRKCDSFSCDSASSSVLLFLCSCTLGSWHRRMHVQRRPLWEQWGCSSPSEPSWDHDHPQGLQEQRERRSNSTLVLRGNEDLTWGWYDLKGKKRVPEGCSGDFHSSSLQNKARLQPMGIRWASKTHGTGSWKIIDTISDQPQALVSPIPGVLLCLVAIKPNSITETELGTCIRHLLGRAWRLVTAFGTCRVCWVLRRTSIWEVQVMWPKDKVLSQLRAHSRISLCSLVN